MTSTVTPEERQELLALPKNNFISSYKVAYHVADSACASHKNYWDIIRACQDHLSGKKPIPVAELEKKGLGWVYNFNYGKARAKIEKGVAESTAKISSALAMGYATLRLFEESDKKDEVLSALAEEEKRGMIASAIGFALCSTLAKEKRLSGWLNEVEYPSYAFGYCALLFNPYDWMPEPIHPLDIAFRPETKPEKIWSWVTFDVLDAHFLYEKWTKAYNESVAITEEDGETQRTASSGWDLEGLEHVLMKAFKGKIDDNKTPERWKEVIPFFKADPSYFVTSTESVTIAKIFYKELDGSLSEVYIPFKNVWQVQSTEKDGTINTTVDSAHIIFRKSHSAFKQDAWIHLIRDSGFTTESGTIQALKGVCEYAVQDSIRYNRQRNALNNKAHFAGAPYFEQPNGQSVEKFKLTVSQGFIILPSSHRMIERQPTFDLTSHINILRFEEGEFMRDTQQYDATIQGRLTSRPNKGEVQRVTEEVEFTDNAKNNIKFRDYASVFYSVIKRISSVKCKEGDVGYEGKIRFYSTMKKMLPWLVTEDEDVDKLLEAVDSFVIEPVTGNIETITIAIQMAETPFARNRLKRMLLLAKGMPIEEVNLAVPMIADKFTNMQDERVAAFENDMFFTTNEIVLNGSDDDIIHLQSHTAKNDRVIQGVQSQSISPVDAFKFLENSLLHCIRHNEKLGADPVLNKKAQEFGEILVNQIKAKNQIRQMAEEMLRQQQEQASQIQIDPETQAKIASDNAKAMADTQRKDWLAQQRTSQAEKKMELSHEARMKEIELKAEEQQ